MWRYKRRGICRNVNIIYVSLLILFIVYFTIPFGYRFSSSLQRHFIFRHDVEPQNEVNFSDPGKEGLNGAYNRYIRTGLGIQVGVWQIVPENLIQLMPSSDGRVQDEWFMNQLRDSRPVVIYFHGNNPSRATLHRILLYKIFQKLDYHVLTFDYRGFADSTKVIPTEDGLVEDAVEIVKWMRKTTKSLLYLWGHSLGTGVATKAASILCSNDICPNGLVLQAPFTSIADELHNIYLTSPFRILPWFHYMFVTPLHNQGIVFNSSKSIQTVTCPILILHAEDDHLVPHFLGKKLYEIGKLLRPPKAGLIKFISFDGENGYGHSFICNAPELPSIIRKVGKISLRKSDDHLPLPVDDVYYVRKYKSQIFTLPVAVDILKEIVHPSQFNAPNADVIAHFELSMSTDKKNKYIEEFSNIILLPHPYEVKQKRIILVLCTDEEMTSKYRSYPGVELALGPECVKMVEKKELDFQQFDHIISHVNLLPDLISIRTQFKGRMPNVKLGTAGNDLDKLIQRFSLGINYKIVKDKIDHDFGFLNISLGKIIMKNEELEENLEAIIIDIENQRPEKLRSDRLITKVTLMTMVTEENFKIDHNKYLASQHSDEEAQLLAESEG